MIDKIFHLMNKCNRHMQIVKTVEKNKTLLMIKIQHLDPSITIKRPCQLNFLILNNTCGLFSIFKQVLWRKLNNFRFQQVNRRLITNDSAKALQLSKKLKAFKCLNNKLKWERVIYFWLKVVFSLNSVYQVAISNNN